MTTTTHPPAVPQRHDTLHQAGLAVRGVLAIGLGVFALARPGVATVLVIAFAIFAIADGAIRMILALRALARDPAWWLHVLEGVVGIAIGVILLRLVRGLITLTWTIAEWAAIIGILSLVFAVIGRRRVHGAWLWALAGIVELAFAVILMWMTLGGVLATGYVIGIFGIVYGIVSIIMAVRRHAPTP